MVLNACLWISCRFPSSLPLCPFHHQRSATDGQYVNETTFSQIPDLFKHPSGGASERRAGRTKEVSIVTAAIREQNRAPREQSVSTLFSDGTWILYNPVVNSILGPFSNPTKP